MEINISEATIDHLKDIQELNTCLFQYEVDEFDNTLDCKWPKAKIGTDYFSKRITDDDGCAFVAVVDGKVVGYLVGAVIVHETWRSVDGLGELENMFISADFRRHGIGTKLYQKFLEWCRSKNVHRIKVEASFTNTKAINFYKKMGYEEYNLILEKDI